MKCPQERNAHHEMDNRDVHKIMFNYEKFYLQVFRKVLEHLDPWNGMGHQFLTFAKPFIKLQWEMKISLPFFEKSVNRWDTIIMLLYQPLSCVIAPLNIDA